MVQLFQKDFNFQFPPAAQINFPLSVDAGHSWQPAPLQACQTQSSKDKRSQRASELLIQLPDVLFLTISQEHPLCS
jgi:hypothetical protein